MTSNFSKFVFVKNFQPFHKNVLRLSRIVVSQLFQLHEPSHSACMRILHISVLLRKSMRINCFTKVVNLITRLFALSNTFCRFAWCSPSCQLSLQLFPRRSVSCRGLWLFQDFSVRKAHRGPATKITSGVLYRFLLSHYAADKQLACMQTNWSQTVVCVSWNKA